MKCTPQMQTVDTPNRVEHLPFEAVHRGIFQGRHIQQFQLSKIWEVLPSFRTL